MSFFWSLIHGFSDSFSKCTLCEMKAKMKQKCSEKENRLYENIGK